MTLKKNFAAAIIIALVLSLAVMASAQQEPAIDIDEVFVARNSMVPQRLEHSGESLRTEILPGSTIYFSIKNARRAEDLNGYRAVLKWNKGEQYTTHTKIEYREMFEDDGVTSLGYRYVIAMGIAELSDDVARTLRGSIKLAKRTNQRTDEISFTISVSNGAPIGKATEIVCSFPNALIDFGALEQTVIMHFGDFCSFEVVTEGQETVNCGCSEKVITDIYERHRQAELRFISWSKKPIFDHVGTMYIYADNDEYLYELLGGKLKRCEADYDEQKGAYVVKIRRLEGFVISDRELDLDAPQIAEANPPTGADVLF